MLYNFKKERKFAHCLVNGVNFIDLKTVHFYEVELVEVDHCPIIGLLKHPI